MEKQQFQIKVSDTIGEVSAELTTGDTTRAILTLAHGAGAGMNHNFMTTLSHTLAEEGIGTLRFNFPFMEQKKKRVDLPAVAHKAIEAAMRKANDLFPTVPLFASGKSFGGRMSSQYLSTHSPDFVKGIIFFGFPLHPAGQPATDRAEHLKNVKVPMLFLQGTRDELAHWALIEKVTSELPLATLVKIEGADHSFKAGKQNTMAWMVKAASDWISE
jgi:hypothetical protein